MMQLTLIVFVIGVLRSFFTQERTRKYLAGKRESAGNVIAALLGIVTPFYSCSAVLLFLGFVQVGIPLGVTFSFLIAAPMVNEIALVLLYGLLGWKVAALYLVTGLLIFLRMVLKPKLIAVFVGGGEAVLCLPVTSSISSSECGV
jgi:uncharacterized protein